MLYQVHINLLIHTGERYYICPDHVVSVHTIIVAFVSNAYV